jgi:trk system potassium uptake protein TrkH
MFIGASSGSTGGGVKTSTVFVVVNFIVNYALGKSANAFYRKISNKVLLKALALINFALLFNVLMTIILCAFEPNIDFKMLLFEQVSAFSTTGLSMGITKDLCWVCDIVLCFVMLMGRLGPLTVMGILNKNWMTDANDEIDYVKENVIIG